MDNRRMCPNCRAFITDSDRTCPYCGQQVGRRAVETRNPAPILGGLIPQAHFTTILILLINAGLFAATELLAKSYGGENYALYALGAKFGPQMTQHGEWWRLVTAGFLHGGWLHIAMNSWVLYDLGAQVEQIYGTPRFLVVYFAGTITGFYLSFLMHPTVLSIGSSAGITGLIGAMIAFGVANRNTIGTQVRDFYVRWVVYILAIGLIGQFGIDNYAHIGGLAAGFCVGWVAGVPTARSSAQQEAMWRVLGASCVIITAFCFLMVYTHFPAPDQLR
jgi:rhomboid protease GluP